MSSSRRPSTVYIPFISSPPRSPHTAPEGYFNYPSVPDSDPSAPVSVSGGGRSRMSRISIPFIRPTRREIVLCLLTLSVSYLFLGGSGSVEGYTYQGGVDGHYRGAGTPPDIGGGGGGASGSGSGLAGPGNAPSRWSFWPYSGSGSAIGAATTAACVGEVGFWESLRTYGTTPPGAISVAGAAPFDTLGEGQAGTGGGGEGEDEFEYSGALGKLGAEAWKGDKSRLVTSLVGHQPGWTVMERVYVYNGSLYVVTEQRNKWPDLVRMTSTGKEANGDPGNAELRLPRGDEIIFITPAEAARLWGPRVQKMAGATWIFNDGQFIDHYYHFAAELLMGAWRAHTVHAPDIGPRGETTLAAPQRIWFLHQDMNQWRDKPLFNPTILFALFPSISMLYPSDWADLRNATTQHRPRAYMLERALLADRSAAFYGEWTTPTSRTVASALMIGETSRWWWEPIRRAVLRHSGLSEATLDRALEGVGAVDPMHFDPTARPAHAQPIGKHPGDVEAVVKQQDRAKYKDVVTYISRQGSRRHLTHQSHEALVRALEEKREEMGFELQVVEAEKLSIEEQFALAGRTTIMLGVHGNGLTHLIWMPATPRSAVIEMYIKGGFARDYQWTAHALGMRHFGINHDQIYTAPDLPEVAYPEGFHGTEITVDARTVADLVARRLKGLV